jgi:hypothetical protein
VPKNEVRNDSHAGTRGELKKGLGLWDVYCIATGAMFSSDFHGWTAVQRLAHRGDGLAFHG